MEERAASGVAERWLIPVGLACGALAGYVVFVLGGNSRGASPVGESSPEPGMQAAKPAPTATGTQTVILAPEERARLAQLALELGAEEASVTPPVRNSVAAPPAVHRPSAQEWESRASAQGESSTAPSGARTLAFWNQINEVLAKEAALRAAPAQVTGANAQGFVKARGEAMHYARGALRRLDAAQVDPDLLAFTQALTAWYDAGVQLNQDAQFLLGQADAAIRRGAPGQAWRAGEEAHRQTCEELNRRGAELRETFSKRYRVAFPPLL